MRRDLWMVFLLGCLAVGVLAAPEALSTLSEDLGGPYEVWAAPVSAQPTAEPTVVEAARVEVDEEEDVQPALAMWR